MITVTESTYSHPTGLTVNPVPYPASISIGDLLMIFLGADSNPSVTLPAGWVIEVNQNPSNRGVFATKRADGTESGTFDVTLSAAEPLSVVVLRAKGSLSNPLYKFVTSNISSGTSHKSPDLIPGWLSTDMLLISSIFGWNTGQSTISTYPTGYDDYTQTVVSGTGTSHSGVGIAYELATEVDRATPTAFVLSGSTGTVTATLVVYEFTVLAATPDFVEINQSSSTSIDIVGDATGGAAVTFDGVPSESVVLQTPQKLVTAVPSSASPGPVDIVVTLTVGGATDSLPDGFTYNYPAPTIASITPGGGQVGIPGSVTIYGSNFRAGATVDINGVPCTSVVVVDANTITCNYPVGVEQSQQVLTVTNASDLLTGSIPFTYMDTIPDNPASPVVNATFSVRAVQFVE